MRNDKSIHRLLLTCGAALILAAACSVAEPPSRQNGQGGASGVTAGPGGGGTGGSAGEACTLYPDDDGDGYGDADATPVDDCDPGPGYVSNAGDCDDANAAIHPNAPETACDDPVDYNCDGSTGYADEDGDGWAACQECLDTNAAVNPDAAEVPYDGLDNDCDAATPDDDLDGDGHPAAEDCDDEDAAVHPDATEVPYDGIDNDCDDATVDDDLDGDGHGYLEDCDEGDASIHPGATELPDDATDQDCDGFEACFGDADGDGFRADVADVLSDDLDCADAGEVSFQYPAGDCDNADGAVHPNATELVADDVDQNCDQLELCYYDADGDGYLGAPVETHLSSDLGCLGPQDARSDQLTGDCCSGDPDVHPGAPFQGSPSACGGWDLNCDGQVTKKYGAYSCWLEYDSFLQDYLCYHSPGFAGPMPDCGETGFLGTAAACNLASMTCGPGGQPNTLQECH
jgi:hypothetical protein